jgi:hypothetical protein
MRYRTASRRVWTPTSNSSRTPTTAMEGQEGADTPVEPTGSQPRYLREFRLPARRGLLHTIGTADQRAGCTIGV